SFSQIDYPEEQCHKQTYNKEASDPAVFFADGTENKVRTLLGYKFQFGLCSLKKPLTVLATTADSHLRLVNVVSCSQLIKIRIQQYADALLLVLLENIVKYKVYAFYRTHQHQRRHGYDGYPPAFFSAEE